MSDSLNFYQLLELDPEIDDWPEIEARIVDKRRQWSRDKTTGNPKQRRVATRALELLPEIERTLRDPEERRAQARAEKKRCREEIRKQEKELDEAIEILQAAGACSEEDADKLVRRFHKSLSEARVRRKLKEAGLAESRAPKPDRKLPDERIDSSIGRTIEQNLRQTGRADLYELLGLRPQSSCTALLDKATELYRENKRLGKTDARTSAENVLLGHAQNIFRDETEKARYDAYLAVAAMESLKPNIALAAASGFLGRQELETLVRQARERGVSAEIARAYLEEHAARHNVRIEREADLAAEELRQCGFCGALAGNPKAARCSECGESLDLECPRCGASNPSTHAACESCGARVGDWPAVLGHHREAELCVSTGHLEEAVRRLEQALRLWPDWKPAKDLKKEIDARRRDLAQRLDELEEVVADRRLIAARQLLERLERDRGPGGLDGLRQRIDQGLAEAETAYRQGEGHRRAGRSEAALDAYEEALSRCADHEAAREAMAASPPPAPEDLEVRPAGEGFRLTWKPGSRRGSPQYRVVRKVGGAPRDDGDGERADVRQALLDDAPVAIGEPWHYAVFTLRGGVASHEAARSGPHLRTAEVEGLSAAAGDGRVTLSFEAPPGCSRVEIWGREGEPPERRGEGRQVSVRGTTAEDTGLANGVRQGYRVFAVFDDPARVGRDLTTPGRAVEAVPVAPPEPVKDLVAQREGDSVLLTWSPVADATVEIRSTREPPPFETGEVLPASEAERFGERVPTTGPASARARLKVQGRHVFIPLSLRRSTLVPGKPREVVTLDPVEDVRARRSGRNIRLTWVWPSGSPKALIRYSEHASPRQPKGGDAISRSVTREAYDRSGGFLLRVTEHRPYHFSVFACAPKDDLYSEPRSTSLHVAEEATVSYEVQVRRHWFRRSIDEAWVELEASGASSLPPVVLIGKSGGVPIHPEDGVALDRHEALRFTEGRARLPIPPEHLRSKLYCKLFFDDPAAAGGWRLLPAARERLLIG